MATKLFYLQDSRSYVGNDMLWWAEAGGYTTDLGKAAVYSQSHAQAKHDVRSSDIPWPKEYIDSKVRPAVDMQYAKRKEAGDAGIVFKKPKKEQAVYHCAECNRFISRERFYTMDSLCETCW